MLQMKVFPVTPCCDCSLASFFVIIYMLRDENKLQRKLPLLIKSKNRSLRTDDSSCFYYSDVFLCTWITEADAYSVTLAR